MHAALITAYKDFPALIRLVRSLRAENIAAYVHVDRKHRFAAEEWAELTREARFVTSRHTIYWGSYSHLAAIIDLAKAALTDQTTSYVHIISGQDFPIGTITDAVDPDTIYMDLESFDDLPEFVRSRIRYRKVLHAIEGVRWLYRPLDKSLRLAQRALGLNRRATRTYGNIFKGLVWLSLPAAAARYCLTDARARALAEELRGFYVPEEYFFQTVLVNSPYRDRIAIGNRRFTLWHEKHGVIPGILDMDDFPAIAASRDLFARKVDTRISSALLAALDQRRKIALAAQSDADRPYRPPE